MHVLVCSKYFNFKYTLSFKFVNVRTFLLKTESSGHSAWSWCNYWYLYQINTCTTYIEIKFKNNNYANYQMDTLWQKVNFWYHVCPCVKTSNLSLNTLKYSLIISIFNNYIAQFDSSNKQLLYTRMNSPNCFSTEKQFGHVLKSFLSVFRFKITCLFWVSKDLRVEAKGVSSSSSIQ